MIPPRSFILAGCLGLALSTFVSAATETNGTVTNTTNASYSQLSVELKDGSRIKGKSLDDPLRFRSSALGEIKLPVADIRSLEFSEKGEAVRLSATNGDVLNLQMQMSDLNLETCFGKVQLPMKLISKVDISKVGNNGDFPVGLVALWSGDGNGNDSIGNHNATELEGVTYVPGKIGMGFNLSGNNSKIVIPASPDLNVGTGSGFTICSWIKPSSAFEAQPLMEWTGTADGRPWWTHFWINVRGAGCLYANLVDDNQGQHAFASAPGIIKAGVFQLVALTYDKVSGKACLYCNGELVASQNFGSFSPKTDTMMTIGQRLYAEGGHYRGILNDVAIYNRALTAEEIQKICASAPSAN